MHDSERFSGTAETRDDADRRFLASSLKRPTTAWLASLPLILYSAPSNAGWQQPHQISEALFILQLVAVLVCARLAGELMQRLGQPAVVGQLLGGMLLGPSALGAVAPQLQHGLFPADPGQKAMVEGVARLGILLLLLLTGMETDFAVLGRARRPTLGVALVGMVIPFAGGVLAGTFLPAYLLPDPSKRLFTALILGVALSVSSIKIIVMVIREAGSLRRTISQVMVAAAMIDDTIGWLVISIIFGVYANGRTGLFPIARSILGVPAFIALSFLVGRRLVFRIIRWTNDSFVTDVPVITAILAITGVMALLTSAIGVGTVLGAFVAGVLIGQSPILTRHIDEQLRGLIFALFMPVFFGLAGATTDLAVLMKPSLILLASGLVAIAAFGKFSGVMLGGRLGGMTGRESLAIGFGMNARGSTEIIVASIGLSIGALNEELFTAIIAMAVVTTLSMTPLLRWALAHAPMTADEASRLEREEFEAAGFVSGIERLLVAVDASPSGRFAARLAGLLAGARRIATTALHLDYTINSAADGAAQAKSTEAVLHQWATVGHEAGGEEHSGDRAEVTTRIAEPKLEPISEEARKGYGLLVIGREPASEGGRFHEQIAGSAAEFGGPFAIVIARGIDRRQANTTALNILVPVIGTSASREAVEVGIALARASPGSITALHVTGTGSEAGNWSRRISATFAPSGAADAIIREAVRLGDTYDVPVNGKVRFGAPQEAILRQIEAGHHNLLVLGVTPRPGDELFFGPVAGALLERAPCSLLFVAGEPLPVLSATNPVGRR